jgi:hypothetical protein
MDSLRGPKSGGERLSDAVSQSGHTVGHTKPLNSQTVFNAKPDWSIRLDPDSLQSENLV